MLIICVQIDRMKSETKDSMVGMKRIYELSIQQLQEALDIQTKSSKDEVEKLKGYIEGLEKKYSRDFESYSDRAEDIQESMLKSSAASPARKQLRIKDKKASGAKSDKKGVNDSFASQASQLYDNHEQQAAAGARPKKDDPRVLQVALNETADELRKVTHSLFVERENHEKEMESVRDNFRQLKLAQEGE
jgi:hypothetical protein